VRLDHSAAPIENSYPSIPACGRPQAPAGKGAFFHQPQSFRDNRKSHAHIPYPRSTLKASRVELIVIPCRPSTKMSGATTSSTVWTSQSHKAALRASHVPSALSSASRRFTSQRRPLRMHTPRNSMRCSHFPTTVPSPTQATYLGIATSFELPSNLPLLPHFRHIFISVFPLILAQRAGERGKVGERHRVDSVPLSVCGASTLAITHAGHSRIQLRLCWPETWPSFGATPCSCGAIGYRQERSYGELDCSNRKKILEARRPANGRDDAIFRSLSFPFEFALLHTKRMSAVPAGHFDSIAIGEGRSAARAYNTSAPEIAMVAKAVFRQ